MDKEPQQRSLAQNKAIHLGCTQIADYLTEHGISLQVAFKDMDIYPTMESIKSIFRQIANAMFQVSSTADLTTAQVDKVWEVLTKSLSENTGIYFSFQSQENTENYLKSYE